MLAPRAEPRRGRAGWVAPPPRGHMNKASPQALGCLPWPEGLPGEPSSRRETLLPLELSPAGGQGRGDAGGW